MRVEDLNGRPILLPRMPRKAEERGRGYLQQHAESSVSVAAWYPTDASVQEDNESAFAGESSYGDFAIFLGAPVGYSKTSPPHLQKANASLHKVALNEDVRR